jgi:NAD+ kinase
MSKVGIVVHPTRAEAHALGRKVAEWLLDAGHEVCLSDRDAGLLSRMDLCTPLDKFGADLDFALSIGGDGSMLATIARVARWNVPVLGVNMGHLGYLTELEPAQIFDALPKVLAGNYDVAERLLLEVVTHTAAHGASKPHLAVNEAVVEKIPLGHTVRLGLELDGNRFTSYAADGMIVATPVGSTAYAFSVRGPIVDPDHRAIVVSPVAPHMLFDRSLVLSPETSVALTLEGDKPAVVAVDGCVLIELEPGDRVVCRAAEVSGRLIRLGDVNFHDTLKRKFGLNEL